MKFKSLQVGRWLLSTVLLTASIGFGSIAFAADPVVKTVPWAASNPLVPHDTWSGKTITLKGTSDVQGANIEYTWDFGDGSPVAVGTVTNQYVVAASHTYTGAPGTIFTARLTVQNTSTGDNDSEVYFVQIQNQTLDVEANVAIDEGLWYLHKTMNRLSADKGDWLQSTSCGTRCASSTFYTATAVNTTAFFVNGHLETGTATNPYTETVQRAMKRVFEMLRTVNIANVTYPATSLIGTVNPDSNANGVGIEVAHVDPPYQGGSFMDVIVASGTPAAAVTTGPVGVTGKTYGEVVQDMVDAYAWGQTHTGPYYGGWRYGWNAGSSDNSTNQWAAIGLIAAEREFGLTVPAWVKTANINSVNLTQTTTGANAGQFGYTNSPNPIWGPYAVTPSGMVQMAMDGIGRGDARWDRSENFMRSRFCNTGGAGNAVRDYYYGLFSFTKSMLLHDLNGDGTAETITDIANQPGNANPLDWYEAEASSGDACDGVARTLINDQNSTGYWYAHNFSGSQYPMETAWAIIMLNRTVFSSGVPVAVAQALPNPGVVGQVITLDGASSFHQDPDKSIVQWDWDLDNDGAFDDATGPSASISFPALGDYPVGLRVTDDDATPSSDDTVVTVRITLPPVTPTADANGPYVFCPQTTPWYLDGTGSNNPDEGQSEIGQPGDTIQTYAWELTGDNLFNDALGAQPDVTAQLTALGIGNYLIQLKVTDTTATSFPSSGFGDLSDTASAQISVKDGADAACNCISDLTARAKDGKVQIVWTDAGAHHYNVYRSTVAGGPYAFVASTTSTYSTYLDSGLTNGTTYHYVVRIAALNGDELCQSNEASGTPAARRRR